MSTSRIGTDKPALHDGDRALAKSIDQAVWSDVNLHLTNADDIKIHCRSGVVHLEGHVGTLFTKSQVGNAVQRVPNVSQLKNQLVVDEELIYRVAQVLGDDARLEGEQQIGVNAQHGFVYLTGRVSNASIRKFAAEVAAGIPEVRGIINRIEAPGITLVVEEERNLQPTIGSEVFVTDGKLGRIQQVVIDPHNRRVIELVVLADFSTFQFLTFSQASNQLDQPMRTLLLPVEVVRHLSKGGVFLTVSSDDAANFSDFNSDLYIKPPTEWQPPYPYDPLDVRLPLPLAVDAESVNAAAANNYSPHEGVQ